MFNPKQVTHEERQRQINDRNRFFAEGECSFEVKDINDGYSKSTGVPMLTIDMIVYDSLGKSGPMKEFITESQDWKLHDFLDAIGRSHLYEVGNNFDINDIIGGCGRFNLKYKKGKDGQEDRNIKYIIDLVKESEPESKPDFDDDIPY